MTYEVGPLPPTLTRWPRGRAARSGSIAAVCLILVVGAAVVVGASSGPRSAAGADPAGTNAANPAAPTGGAVEHDGDRAAGKGLGEGTSFGGRFGFGAITIASIEGTKIGLKTADGWTRTIVVTSDTKIFLGSTAGQLSDLAVGNTVLLRQKRNADGSFSIVSLRVPPAQAGGVVTAVSADSITLKRRDGSTTTLTVNGSTVYRREDAAASLADVKVGSVIESEGKPGSSDAFTATVVEIALSRVVGEVTAKTAATITVKLRDGSSVVIHVDPTTRYVTRGQTAAKPSLADVAIGNMLVASGIRRADGSLDAVAVGTGKAKLDKAKESTNPSTP